VTPKPVWGGDRNEFSYFWEENGKKGPSGGGGIESGVQTEVGEAE